MIDEVLKSKLGSIAEALTYTTDLKEELIVDLKMFMEKGEIDLPDNKKLIDQLHTLERTVTSSGRTKYTHQDGKHDDYVFSVANALKGFSGIIPIRSKDLIVGRQSEQINWANNDYELKKQSSIFLEEDNDINFFKRHYGL